MNSQFTKLMPLIKDILSRQNWPVGVLYLAATPIGNLADISLRVLYALEMADVLACEDTRHSKLLLDYYGIRDKQLLAVHQHNEIQRSHDVIDLLQQGKRVVYISDAGTPAISDPGAKLVEQVTQAGLPVRPLPGASSVIAALSVAAIKEGSEWVFVGFLPTKGQQRQAKIDNLRCDSRALVILESPHRIQALARELEQFNARLLSVSRELTKQFEETALMPALEFSTWLGQNNKRLKGEYVLILHPIVDQPIQVDESIRWLQDLLEYLPVKYAALLIAKWTGKAKNEVYQQALELKKNTVRRPD